MGFDVDAGVPEADRATDFRVAVDRVETVERTDAVDTVRFATGLILGTGSDILPLTDGVVLEATDGGRLGTRGVPVPVVRTLVVEIDDAADDLRVRPTLLAVSSDRAVSNAVEFSLALDVVEAGREERLGARRVDGPAAPRRMVEAVERVDLMEDATDFGRGTLSAVAVEWTEAELFRMLAVDMLFRGTGLGLGESGDFARPVSAILDRPGEGVERGGVSFESGRKLLDESGARRDIVVVVTRDVVVCALRAMLCVLRATDRTDAADDLTLSRPATDLATLRTE